MSRYNGILELVGVF